MEDIIIDYKIRFDSVGDMKIGRYIFSTNKFDILLEIYKDNIVNIGFMMHSLDFLVDEINGGSNLTIEDIKYYFKDLKLSKTKDNIQILPLTNYTVNEANNLKNNIFPNIKDIEKDTLYASLDKQKYEKSFEVNFITSSNYFIVKNKQNKVIGLTGIYTEVDDDIDMCWLGWFCIDFTFRGEGLGKVLMDFSIAKAKEMKKNYLHLYTYGSKEFLPAIKLYEKYGAKRYKPSHKVSKRDYYRLKLN